MGNFELKTSAFKNNGLIPARFTCDGEDLNPFFEIKNPPDGTKSFVLIMDDPDATRGVPWDHWLLWNIPPETRYIPEGGVPHGSVSGITSFGNDLYGGPCPPRGSKPHRYMFKLYALDSLLDLESSATKAEIEKNTDGHILGQASLLGLYQRQ